MHQIAAVEAGTTIALGSSDPHRLSVSVAVATAANVVLVALCFVRQIFCKKREKKNKGTAEKG